MRSGRGYRGPDGQRQKALGAGSGSAICTAQRLNTSTISPVAAHGTSRHVLIALRLIPSTRVLRI